MAKHKAKSAQTYCDQSGREYTLACTSRPATLGLAVAMLSVTSSSAQYVNQTSTSSIVMTPPAILQCSRVSHPVDPELYPIVVDHFTCDKKTLKLRKKLSLVPHRDDPDGLIILLHPELGIDVYAYSREILLRELDGQLRFLWQNYALAADSILSPSGLKLKHALLAAVKRDRDAEG